MTDPHAAPAPAPGTGDYPVSLTFDLPDRIARWRPLVHWLLAIPHLILAYALGSLGGVMSVAAWFSGVITGQVPQMLLDFMALSLRYNARVTAYVFFLHETYPPFTLETQTADPGDDPHVRLDLPDETDDRNRVTIFFRYFLAIPHFVVLWFLGIALFVVYLIGWFAVVILGRWPAGLRRFVIGNLRWRNRVSGYIYLFTDEYPPFSLK